MIEKLCTCRRCGWIGIAITKKEAIRELSLFNSYYAGLTKAEKRRLKDPKTSLRHYRCHLCAGDSFRPFKESDRPSVLVEFHKVIAEELA